MPDDITVVVCVGLAIVAWLAWVVKHANDSEPEEEDLPYRDDPNRYNPWR